jgi:N-acetyl-anhydromuramyl-L-alanine amidase AmpD
LQQAAVAQLCRELLARHHLPRSSLHSHREVDGDTECPGERFPMQRLRAELGAGR